MKTFFSLLLVLITLWMGGQFNKVLAIEEIPLVVQEEASAAAIDWSSLTVDPGALDVGDSLIAPNSALYFLKSIRENFELRLAENSYEKAQKELEFSVRRLREVKSLIEVNREDLIEHTLERYRNSLNYIEQVFVKNTDIGISIARHMFVLETLYHQTTDPSAKRMIRASIIRAFDYTKNSINQVKDPQDKQKFLENVLLRQIAACKFLAQESRAGDLNDTEQAYLKSLVVSCQKVVDEDFLGQLNNHNILQR